MVMEYKSVKFDLKEVNNEKNVFEGYASVFHNKDSHGDIIEPNAFTKTINERGHRIKVLWQHDMFTPIGKAIDLKEDNYGLYVKAQISETPEGKRAMTLIKDGVIDELSIGYSVVKDEFDTELEVRRLKEIKLFEFSPVTFASNDQAVITGAKYQQQLANSLMQLNGGLGSGVPLTKANEELVRNTIQSLEKLLGEMKNNNSSNNIDNNIDSNYNMDKDISELVEEIKLDTNTFSFD